MFGSWGPPQNVLRRPDSNVTSIDAEPGAIRWFQNKGTDQATVANSENVDGTGYWAVFAQNKTGSPLTVGKFYELWCDGTPGDDPQVRLFVDGVTTVRRVAVCAKNATANAKWDWFAIQGVVPFALVEGTTAVAVGNSLKIKTNSPGGVSVPIKDQTSDFSEQTIGFAQAAQGAAGNVTTQVYLVGREALVNQT